MKAKDMEGYNGPGREQFIDALGEYEEYRFEIMRFMSKAGKVIARWESLGGSGDDMRDGYKLRKMEPDEQKAELRRQFRVAGWLGVVDEDSTGQRGFLRVFDIKAPETGIGGAPIGSRLSIIRAKAAGYNDGKSKNGPSLQDGIELYGFAADGDEALSYAEGFGEGLPLRPPPKVRKGDGDDDAGEGESEINGAPSALDAMTARIAELDIAEAPKRGRGRPRKQPALPAPVASSELPVEAGSVEDIWDGVRMPVPPFVN